jgi:hypothetical protein
MTPEEQTAVVEVWWALTLARSHLGFSCIDDAAANLDEAIKAMDPLMHWEDTIVKPPRWWWERLLRSPE